MNFLVTNSRILTTKKSIYLKVNDVLTTDIRNIPPRERGGGIVNLFFAIVRLESYRKPGCIDQTMIRHVPVRQVRVVIVGKESKKHSKYIDYYVLSHQVLRGAIGAQQVGFHNGRTFCM